MTAASALLAEIAARYGVGVAPDARVTRVPPGVSAQSLPTWDGKQLVYPDWKARLQAAAQSQVKGMRKRRAHDQHVVTDRLRAMHAAGDRVPAMAEALGLSRDRVYGLLSSLGLRMERDPAQMLAAQERMVTARLAQLQDRHALRLSRIRHLVSQGAGVEAIGLDLGLRDLKNLREMIRKACPGHLLPSRPRGPKPKPANTTARALRDQKAAMRRQVHVARNARILDLHRATATVETIMHEIGLTRTIVARVLREAGEVPAYQSQRDHAARMDALPGLIAEGLGAEAIAARWGCTVHAVHQIASRSGVSLNPVRPVVHNKGKTGAKVKARRQWIAAMVRRGATDAEMLRATGLHQSTLSADIAALGLSCSRKRGGDRRGVGRAGQGEGVAE